MTRIVWILMLGTLFAAGCRGLVTKRIAASDLGSAEKFKVIGALGLPICSFVQVRAVVVAGKALHSKQYDGSYLLNVTHVRGELRSKPIMMSFHDRTYELPSDIFDLHERLHGEKKGMLTSSEIQMDEATYVGKTVELLVYETGAFGSPSAEMDSTGEILGQGEGYGFSTHLEVCKVIKGIPVKGKVPNTPADRTR